MAGKKVKGQFYLVMLLAMIVLGICAWAFIEQVTTSGKDVGVVQENMPGKEIRQDKGKNKTKTVDTKTLAETVISEVAFETELVRMDETVIESMITTAQEGTSVELYMGEGTCSDELLIVTAPDEASTQAEIENVQKHLTEMQQSFQDYLPKEAKKIDDAVILQMKNYIVACVSSDGDNAKRVIEKQLNG